MDRLFLDANILFSAAYHEASPLLRHWGYQNVELLTSGYALDEARRNLDSGDRHVRLDRLAESIRIVAEGLSLPDIAKPVRQKDVPILAAAVACGATHLLTLDRRDFGRLFGLCVGGVRVLHPRD